MQRSTWVATALASALAGAALGAWLLRAGPPAETERATLIDPPRPLPAIALADPAGRPFGRERLAGRWSLLFFGFTHCPDVCPTTLAQLGELKRRLAGLPADDQPQVVFVSVDPGRDTPDLLGRYVAHFDASFTGVTGTATAIDALTRALGVPVLVGAAGSDGSYTVDHGAALYVIGPDARWRAVSSPPFDVDVLARDWRRIVAAGAR